MFGYGLYMLTSGPSYFHALPPPCKPQVEARTRRKKRLALFYR